MSEHKLGEYYVKMLA